MTENAASTPVIAFEHAFFRSFDDLYFRLSEQTGEPVAIVNLGGTEATLGFRGICHEFSIEPESADGKMLETVTQALDYVSLIRIGDAVPREMLTGEASWEPEPKHHAIAYHRLTMQMVTWLSGDEHLITDSFKLLQIADDPQTKKRVNEAFGQAAERLGLGRERKQEVVAAIEAFSHELAYIEALRDKLALVHGIEATVQGLRRLYGHERSVLDIADPCARLMHRAVEGFDAAFDEVDAQTGEILGLLRNVDAQVRFVRGKRDSLHHRLAAWEEIFALWHGVGVDRDMKMPDRLRQTYHFLAPRYMPVNEWALVTQPRKISDQEMAKAREGNGKGQGKGKLGGVMTW